jgi:cobalt-precorrin-6B (C15)-methyltransferase
MSNRKHYLVPGIPDEQFLRGEVPLTKSEIRCLTLSLLRLAEGQRVLDIGAGSGGLSIECALLLKNKGSVCAVERDKEAVALIRANLAHFGVDNVTLVESEAPEALEGLGSFDRIMIGGSGGNLPAIIEASREMLTPGGVLVINCILFETLNASLELLKNSSFGSISFIQAAIARSRQIGGGTALQPLNPVFIVSAVKGAC